jgi:non-ribosomal peptide synthetase component E (peptide arylation enzyme)
MIEDYCQRGLWSQETLSDIWDRNAKEYPGKEALKDSHRQLTWAEVKLWTDRVALSLRSWGLAKDDAVVVQLPNWSELLMMHIACEKAGLLYIPAMRNLQERELKHILNETEARAIVIPWKFKDTDYYAMVQGLLPVIPQLKHIIICGNERPQGIISLSEMVTRSIEREYPADYIQRIKMPPFEVCFIRPTSGTTGMPKLVELPYVVVFFNRDIGSSAENE